MYSFMNHPDLTELLICRRHWGYRRKILTLYHQHHTIFWRRQGHRNRKVHKCRLLSALDMSAKERDDTGSTLHRELLEIMLDEDLHK